MGREASAVRAAAVMYRRTRAACVTVQCSRANVFASEIVPVCVAFVASDAVVKLPMAAFGEVLLMAARRAMMPMPKVVAGELVAVLE